MLERLAAELPRERLWGQVVDRVDAPTARACVFTAAVLAAEQAREMSQPPSPLWWREKS